ncbi:MAG TPA: glycosyltransferase [Candidatus Hydrogenedentes bacterium]|nr:glycosyltransferase [Candidatus Hydrogenedentota bacterium]
MNRDQLLALADLVPHCARRVLVAGVYDETLATNLRGRGATEVHALADPMREMPGFDSVQPLSLRGDLPFPTRYFDAILLPMMDADPENTEKTIMALAPFLAKNGYAMGEAANAAYWRNLGRGTNIESIRAVLEAAGLQLYGLSHSVAEDDPEAEQDGDCLVIEGRRLHAPDESARQSLLTPFYRFTAIRPEYNPMEHACARFDAGHPEEAYEILAQIPPICFDNPEVATAIHSTILLCLLALVSPDTSTSKNLNRLMKAQWSFYTAIALSPHLQSAYRAQAEIWHRIGHADMAVRLLRSIQHVAPDKDVAAQLAGYGSPSRIEAPDDTAPPWNPPAHAPRLLFVTHPRPHYGLDILYDGLCAVLGDENVVEFPWKPSLHGQPPATMANYPCVFDRPGARWTLDAVLNALDKGTFDAVLYGDLEQSLRRTTARRIVQAAAGTPVFLFDAQDTCDDRRADMAEFLRIPSFAGVFKREMLIGADYGPNVFPLPFAYPDGRVPTLLPDERPYDLFWAGHREFGLRRLYLERLESLTGQSFSLAFPQEDYVKVMRASRIGLNIFGMGFDTVRYWELPAHGCMLLAERLPIRVPHGFTDGINAVFFDDMRELEEKLAYYIAHRNEIDPIARAGHAHFLRHHTGSARARQALAWMRQCGAFDRCYMSTA